MLPTLAGVSATTSTVIDRVIDGRYHVESLLARGGMASVYQATDLRLERPVALKVMHPDLARDEAFVARFRREARAAARLQHPHVVAVYDQGEDDDLAFLAMELVEGETLREVILRHGPHSARDAAAILDPVLQALQAAHRAGLVHRDVKPENVLLHRSGAIKVADFGLARAISASTTSNGDVTWGTAAYLSPEQVEHGTADARSDVYAAGLMLFELLTGTKAFPGDVALQVAYAHVHGQVPRASDTVPTVPAELDALIQWATAADPERRPVDAGALLEELRHSVATLSEDELDALPGRADPVGGGDLTQRFDATRPLRTSEPAPSPAPAQSATSYARTTGNRKPRPVARRGQAPRRRGFVGWTLGILLVLLAAGGAGATWYFAAGPGIHSAMPVVEGLRQDQARAALDREDLDAVVTPSYSESVRAGVVISASARPGTELRHGTDVDLVVSQGPERYAVPDLERATLEEAAPLVEQAHLVLGEPTQAWSPDVPVGQIVSTDPEVGAMVKPGTTVQVVVSKGRQPVDIPAVTGRPQGEAQQALTDAGFTVTLDPVAVHSAEVPAGAVVSQAPSGGQGYPGDTVTLVISLGPEMITMPSVVGLQWSDVEPQLTAQGFVVTREDIAGGYFGTIRFQSVNPDERVPKGTAVVLTVL